MWKHVPISKYIGVNITLHLFRVDIKRVCLSHSWTMRFLSFLWTNWMENFEEMISATHLFAYSHRVFKKCFVKKVATIYNRSYAYDVTEGRPRGVGGQTRHATCTIAKHAVRGQTPACHTAELARVRTLTERVSANALCQQNMCAQRDKSWPPAWRRCYGDVTSMHKVYIDMSYLLLVLIQFSSNCHCSVSVEIIYSFYWIKPKPDWLILLNLSKFIILIR